jgi:hypothetical protein
MCASTNAQKDCTKKLEGNVDFPGWDPVGPKDENKKKYIAIRKIRMIIIYYWN